MPIDHTSHSISTSHRWTLRFTVSLSAIIALFGTWGWLTHYGLVPRQLALAAGGVLMAGVCLVAQGVCNNMAVEARRARVRGLKWSFRAATLVALGFGAVSAMGLHHGWQIAEAVAPTLGVIAPPDWLMTALFVLIAFGEPVSFWIVEAVRSGEARGEDSLTNQDAPTGVAGGPTARDRARDWSPKVVGKEDGGARPTKASNAAGVVAAAALVLGGAAGEGAAAQPMSQSEPATATVSDANQDGRAISLAEGGWSERKIATELGLSRHAVRRALGRSAA